MTNSLTGPDSKVEQWERFVEQVIIPTGVSDPIVQAFRDVDRAIFVPDEHKQLAYTDEIIPIRDGATISQPSLVAKMIDILELSGNEKVLEIGTASGYGAALLSRLAAEVHTIEYDTELADHAGEVLHEHGYANVIVHNGDGAIGLADEAPFDAIIVTASMRKVPTTFKDQLAENGIMLVPIGDDPDTLILLGAIKTKGKLLPVPFEEVRFVRLVSSQPGGWPPDWDARIREARLKRLAQIAPALDLSPADTLELIMYIAREVMRVPAKYLDPETALKFITLTPDELRVL